jgi:hypothetical protein
MLFTRNLFAIGKTTTARTSSYRLCIQRCRAQSPLYSSSFIFITFSSGFHCTFFLISLYSFPFIILFVIYNDSQPFPIFSIFVSFFLLSPFPNLYLAFVTFHFLVNTFHFTNPSFSIILSKWTTKVFWKFDVRLFMCFTCNLFLFCLLSMIWMFRSLFNLYFKSNQLLTPSFPIYTSFPI